MKFAWMIGPALALLGLGQLRSDDKKDAATTLDGKYTLVSGEKFGKPIPEERIKGHTVRFMDDKIVAFDNNNKEVYVATFKIDREQKPWVISMTSLVPDKGHRAQGLIERKGDEVRLIYSLKAGDTPKEFKTIDQQLLMVLKRVEK